VNLCLRSSRLTDGGIRHLGDLLTIRSLEIQGIRIQGNGLQVLAAMPNLNKLAIAAAGSSFTDVSLRQLLESKSLQHLDVSGISFTGDVQHYLAPESALKEIDVVGVVKYCHLHRRWFVMPSDTEARELRKP
jgi:hypothetical protein